MVNGDMTKTPCNIFNVNMMMMGLCLVGVWFVFVPVPVFIPRVNRIHRSYDLNKFASVYL